MTNKQIGVGVGVNFKKVKKHPNDEYSISVRQLDTNPVSAQNNKKS